MNVLIPIALNNLGVPVTAICSKSDGPFTCMECNKCVILKQGDVKRWHFSHYKRGILECSAGGESSDHMAAKLLLVKYITRFNFTSTCLSGNHTHRNQYVNCTAIPEYRYDGIHSADVAVFNGEQLKSIVEVKVSHSTTGDSLATRKEHVGDKHVWEINATEILDCQTKLVSGTNMITLHSRIPYEDSRCEKECIHLEQKCMSKRPCHICRRWGHGFFKIYTPRRYIETKNFKGSVTFAYICCDCCRECSECSGPMQEKYGSRCYICNLERLRSS